MVCVCVCAASACVSFVFSGGGLVDSARSASRLLVLPQGGMQSNAKVVQFMQRTHTRCSTVFLLLVDTDTVYRMFYMDDCKGLLDYCCGSLARLMLTLLTADKLLLWTSPASQTSVDTDTESHQQFHHLGGALEFTANLDYPVVCGSVVCF